MVTSFDDFPIHQTSRPIELTANGEPNFYDRYFFNGYSRDGSTFFALAMGLYPNRHIADAAFCVVLPNDASGRRQHSVFHSQRAPVDRQHCTSLGPITIDVVEPLQRLAITVDAPEHGLRAELTFEGRSAAFEEPHFFQRAGNRTFLDFTRLTQFGTWRGWLEVDGERHQITPQDTWGSRDRSWGIRPIGERASTGAPTIQPQYFWLWAPVNFPSHCTHFDVNEHDDGQRWHEAGAIAAEGDSFRTMRAVDWRVQWRPGTRWADNFEYDLIEPSGTEYTIRLEPLFEFQMRGIGYGHPEFGHGFWKGEFITGGEKLDLPVATPLAREHIHVQAVCRATLTTAAGSVEHGIGTLEQLCIGPHPSGLTGLLDGFQRGSVDR